MNAQSPKITWTINEMMIKKDKKHYRNIKVFIQSIFKSFSKTKANSLVNLVFVTKKKLMMRHVKMVSSRKVTSIRL